MDEWSAWESFFTTGYVLDYLRYKSVHNQNNLENRMQNQKEAPDEIPYGGAYNQGTEYR